MLSEIEAWKVLRLVFKHRTGFCYAIQSLNYNSLITSETSVTMVKSFVDLPDTPESMELVRGYKFPVIRTADDWVRLEFIQKQIKRCNNA